MASAASESAAVDDGGYYQHLRAHTSAVDETKAIKASEAPRTAEQKLDLSQLYERTVLGPKERGHAYQYEVTEFADDVAAPRILTTPEETRKAPADFALIRYHRNPDQVPSESKQQAAAKPPLEFKLNRYASIDELKQEAKLAPEHPIVQYSARRLDATHSSCRYTLAPEFKVAPIVAEYNFQPFVMLGSGAFGSVFRLNDRLSTQNTVFKYCQASWMLESEYEKAHLLFDKAGMLKIKDILLMSMENLGPHFAGQVTDPAKFFENLFNTLSKLRRAGYNHCDLHAANIADNGYVMDPGCITKIGEVPVAIHRKFTHLMQDCLIDAEFDIRCLRQELNLEHMDIDWTEATGRYVLKRIAVPRTGRFGNLFSDIDFSLGAFCLDGVWSNFNYLSDRPPVCDAIIEFGPDERAEDRFLLESRESARTNMRRIKATTSSENNACWSTDNRWVVHLHGIPYKAIDLPADDVKAGRTGLLHDMYGARRPKYLLVKIHHFQLFFKVPESGAEAVADPANVNLVLSE